MSDATNFQHRNCNYKEVVKQGQILTARSHEISVTTQAKNHGVETEYKRTHGKTTPLDGGHLKNQPKNSIKEKEEFQKSFKKL